MNQGKRIRINILYMNLNDTSGCFNDYLSIEDNGYEIERFCGRPSNEYAFLSRSVEFSDFPAHTQKFLARNGCQNILMERVLKYLI